MTADERKAILEEAAKVAEMVFSDERLYEGRRDGGEVIANAIRALSTCSNDKER